MATSADVVAQSPVYPGPDVCAWPDAIEADLVAQQPVYPGPDVSAWPMLSGPWPAAAALPVISGTLQVTIAEVTLTATGTVADPVVNTAGLGPYPAGYNFTGPQQYPGVWRPG